MLAGSCDFGTLLPGSPGTVGTGDAPATVVELADAPATARVDPARTLVVGCERPEVVATPVAHRGLPAKRPNVLRIAGAGLAQKGRAAPQITGHVSLDEAKLTVVYSADAGSYPGQAVTTPSGDSSACDPSPAWGHPAIDINISEISLGIIDKIHFP